MDDSTKKQLQLLKIIKDNTVLKDGLEIWFTNAARELKDFRVRSRNKSAKEKWEKSYSVAKKLAKQISQTCGGNAIEEEAAKLYLSLDILIYPQIMSELSDNYKRQLNIPTDCWDQARTWQTINAETIKMNYSSASEKIVNFFESNIELFPQSTRKMIDSKMIKEEEKFNTKIIINEFQKKAFIKELPEKYDKQRIQKILNKFLKIEDNTQKILTMGYFYDAIYQKYEGQKEIMTSIRTAATDSFGVIAEFFDSWLEKNKLTIEQKQLLKNLKKILKDNPGYMTQIAKETERPNVWTPPELVYWLKSCAKEKEDIKKLNESLYKEISRRLSHMGSFIEVSHEVKEKLVEEFAKQYTEKYKE